MIGIQSSYGVSLRYFRMTSNVLFGRGQLTTIGTVSPSGGARPDGSIDVWAGTRSPVALFIGAAGRAARPVRGPQMGWARGGGPNLSPLARDLARSQVLVALAGGWSREPRTRRKVGSRSLAVPWITPQRARLPTRAPRSSGSLPPEPGIVAGSASSPSLPLAPAPAGDRPGMR